MSSKALFTSVQIGAVTLKNRIGMSALTRDRSIPTNVPNAVNLEYYAQRADAGLIVSEGTLIVQQGSEWPHAPGIWNQEQVAAWAKIVDAVHGAGSKIFCQLWHLGRVSHPDAPEQKASGLPVYGPSAIAARGGKFRHLPGAPGYVTPTVLDDPSIVLAQYKQAAINAKAAGFDGVELHSANGYLIAQFLDSDANKRTDKYGGSVENRARFGLEALQILVDVWGADRVGIKITPAGGYNDVGMNLQDTLETFKYYISEVDKFNLAYIVIVRHVPAMDPVIDGKTRATVHDIVASYRSSVTKSKFFVNGALTPDEAEELVASGKVDGIFFGFPYVTHPDVATRIEKGKPLDNRPDFAHLYGKSGGSLEDQKVGYTDYPAAEV